MEPSSGLTRAVPAMAEAVGRQGATVRLHVQSPAPTREFRDLSLRVYRPLAVPPSILAVSPEMRRGLESTARTSDILHSHVVWQMPGLYTARAARRAGRPMVYSPSGTLSEWALAFSRWRKKAAWMLAQGRAFRQSTCFHATSEMEYADVRRVGLKGTVAVIPLGVDMPAEPSLGLTPEGRKRLLFLSRIHPKKGVENLVRSWRQVQDQFPDWELTLVGGDPDSPGYLKQMRELAAELGAQRIDFRGQVSEEERAEILRHTSLFVLPTHSDNFALVVVEALGAGIPAIVTKGAPWSALEREGCGWWIDIGEGPLTECLRSTLPLGTDELQQMGQRCRRWVERDFSWNVVGRRLFETYQWILGGGNPPPWVRTS